MLCKLPYHYFGMPFCFLYNLHFLFKGRHPLFLEEVTNSAITLVAHVVHNVTFNPNPLQANGKPTSCDYLLGLPRNISLYVRHYHAYQDLWTQVVGQILLLKREPGNSIDKYTCCSDHSRGSRSGSYPL